MGLDIAVLDDEFKYMRHIHIDSMIHSVLFKKLVNVIDYPTLGKASDEREDITIRPKMIPELISDLDRLDTYLDSESIMSPEVKARCREFVKGVREMGEVAMEDGRNVEFIAGE